MFFQPSEVISFFKCFTDALLNIKHLGAIDRIALGISTFCKRFYEMSNTDYSNLAGDLLDGIIDNVGKGDCQSIFRRSAGLPSAISALLKCEPTGMKLNIFPKVLNRLHHLSSHDVQGHPEIRIHALNILKFIYQDSELKNDMDQYIAQGLALAIKGFADNDWSVRNSSLMLYSAIMKRVFVNVSNESQANYKSGLNIIQFFAMRAPSLLKFFFEEILQYSKKSTEHNMYPTLYPISLILSKLLPFDVKTADKDPEGAQDEGLVEGATKEEPTEGMCLDDIDDEAKNRYITPSEISQFRSLLLACANGRNFLGRVLVARAIVPFVSVGDMHGFLDSILPKTLKEVKRDHNNTHGRLLIAKFVIANFKSFCVGSNYRLESNVPGP